MKFGDQEYTAIMGSDIVRDGMFLELWKGDQEQMIAEIFYADGRREFSLSTFQESVPLPAIEWLIQEAQRRLPQEG